jgi:hypothetical protein
MVSADQQLSGCFVDRLRLRRTATTIHQTALVEQQKKGGSIESIGPTGGPCDRKLPENFQIKTMTLPRRFGHRPFSVVVPGGHLNHSPTTLQGTTVINDRIPHRGSTNRLDHLYAIAMVQRMVKLAGGIVPSDPYAIDPRDLRPMQMVIDEQRIIRIVWPH